MGGKLSITIFLLVCLVWKAQAAVNCTATGVGRFADPADTTCKNYSLCALDSNTNTILTYNYSCPTTSVFNPTTRVCTTNYVCPTNGSTTNTTTTAVCTTDGFVADPSSTDCTTYIQCVNIGGTFSQTTLTCPSGTFYNPTTTFCEVSYTCPTTQTISCTSVGRIANTTDTTCQGYVLCVAATNGTLLQYSYTCPTTSLFNPNTRVCTTNYTCPN
ncbi:uncharacterized protein LOC119833347 [Zerene cesonia]|uniref:uncharacterized protein LOC119833347 n=1 Tax=Zerene cesonia TaxID=33412 RepID=UPI0018E52334|nr:uncharacterized protein LOC119833347 [Zerene cesonia]